MVSLTVVSCGRKKREVFQNNILPTDPFASASILADLTDLPSAYWFGVVLGAGWGEV